MISIGLPLHLLGENLLVEPCEVDLLRVAHVVDILEKCEIAEDILYGKCPMSPDTLH
jgi:hypothetical protein